MYQVTLVPYEVVCLVLQLDCSWLQQFMPNILNP